MAYTALYRKFRPSTFAEMVGQDHITKTLKNQIMAGRVGHAYLLNGGRGTGKTSVAKILARAIDCLNPKEGEPCNECEVCRGALSGSLTDIVEMDAASNNSVEDIRQIREEVNFLPTVAKYRVYIIDEVHMLSTGAFNALLKTLEEPPEHVKFILATTEPQKLPATILSRCQRFDFKKISNENIEKRLQYVCEESKIEITKGALKIIAVLAEGAMRDALSILERCLQEGETKIDEEKIKDLVGIPKLAYITKITEAILEGNVEKTLQAIEDIVEEGKDLQNFLWEMIKYSKDILVYKASQKLQIYSEEEIKKIQDLSQKVEKDTLLKIIYTLSNLENEIKWSSQKLILFQVAMIKLCNKEQNTTIGDNTQIQELQRKVQNLEEKIQIIHKTGTNVDNKTSFSSNNVQNKEIKAKPETKLVTLVEGKLAAWPKIVGELKQEGKVMLYTNLINTIANQINDMTVGIQFPNGLTPFGRTILEKPENIAELEKRISTECGKTMRVKIIEGAVKEKNKEALENNALENLAQDLSLPFNVIE